eukprot:gb/GEZN01013841.1/.p1 GENE.gb/GEZN01013841.1/~~gb/GEZN01013841.1/.p1  ORF type:complete len:289 (+),score=78.41 gb/GEZN01013841.1/:32-898(+)
MTEPSPEVSALLVKAARGTPSKDASSPSKDACTQANGVGETPEERAVRIALRANESRKRQLKTFLANTADNAAVEVLWRKVQTEKRRLEKQKEKEDAETKKKKETEIKPIAEQLEDKADAILIKGWVIASSQELIQQDNPLLGQVVPAGAALDTSSKKISTFHVKWEKAFLALTNQALYKFDQEVNEGEVKAKPPLAMWEFGAASSIRTVNDIEFEVLPGSDDSSAPLGLRVLDKDTQGLWILAFETHFKAVKKREKRRQTSTATDRSDGPQHSSPDKERDEEVQAKN